MGHNAHRGICSHSPSKVYGSDIVRQNVKNRAIPPLGKPISLSRGSHGFVTQITIGCDPESCASYVSAIRLWGGSVLGEYAMLAKCANPVCEERFLRFTAGRLFRLAAHARKEEYFWLCGTCSTTYTLTLDNNGRAVVQPKSNAGAYPENGGSAPPAGPTEPPHNSALHTTRGGRHGMRSGRRG